MQGNAFRLLSDLVRRAQGRDVILMDMQKTYTRSPRSPMASSTSASHSVRHSSSSFVPRYVLRAMTVRLCLSDPTSHKQLTSVGDAIVKSKRIVFVSGAGISCSAGIPVSVLSKMALERDTH